MGGDRLRQSLRLRASRHGRSSPESAHEGNPEGTREGAVIDRPVLCGIHRIPSKFNHCSQCEMEREQEIDDLKFFEKYKELQAARAILMDASLAIEDKDAVLFLSEKCNELKEEIEKLRERYS